MYSSALDLAADSLSNAASQAPQYAPLDRHAPQPPPSEPPFGSPPPDGGAAASASGGSLKRKASEGPKRPPSAMNAYVKQVFPEYRRSNPERETAELRKELKNAWETLDAKTQQPYHDAYDAEMAVYRQEMARLGLETSEQKKAKKDEERAVERQAKAEQKEKDKVAKEAQRIADKQAKQQRLAACVAPLLDPASPPPTDPACVHLGQRESSESGGEGGGQSETSGGQSRKGSGQGPEEAALRLPLLHPDQPLRGAGGQPRCDQAGRCRKAAG